MRKIGSMLLFTGFLIHCVWEIVPNFYELATQENAMPLFVASTKENSLKERTGNAGQKVQEIDYKQLTKGMNTKGA